MMQSEIIVRPVYLLHTEPNGKQHVQEHLVWGDGGESHGKRFFAARVAEKDHANKFALAEALDDGHTHFIPLGGIEAITLERYREIRWAR